MSTWFRRMLRSVLPSVIAPHAPRGPTQRTIRWSMDDPPTESDLAWLDTDFDASYAQTRPMMNDTGGWLISSIDLVSGVDVVESDDDSRDTPPPPGRGGTLQGRQQACRAV